VKKICSKKDCHLEGIEQDISKFSFRNKKEGKYKLQCKNCDNISDTAYRKTSTKSKTYYINNKIRLLEYQKDYRENNKEKVAESKVVYYFNNKEKIAKQKRDWYSLNETRLIEHHKEYRKNNKKKLSIQNKEYYKNNAEALKAYQKEYRKTNKDKRSDREKKLKQEKPSYKLRINISGAIYQSLKRKFFSKNGLSCLKILPYNIEELKNHLESQFESWMNWNNSGRYLISKWDDNDQSTWTWQIDHIIPHSTFKYTSMEDQSFQECWALGNLRPYSAKQNVIDGTSRIRHQIPLDM
jgi:mannose/fructose/N-acetylgalactosamine-specific phosphotransferase system component IIB